MHEIFCHREKKPITFCELQPNNPTFLLRTHYMIIEMLLQFVLPPCCKIITDWTRECLLSYCIILNLFGFRLRGAIHVRRKVSFEFVSVCESDRAKDALIDSCRSALRPALTIWCWRLIRKFGRSQSRRMWISFFLAGWTHCHLRNDLKKLSFT